MKMSKKYIDANKVIDYANQEVTAAFYYPQDTQEQRERDEQAYRDKWAFVKQVIVNMPAADVEEVRYGHWEKVDDNPYEYVAACSVCRNEVKQPTCMLKPIYSYCPICGALMVSEDEEIHRCR